MVDCNMGCFAYFRPCYCGELWACLGLESCSNGVVGIILHKIPAAVEPDAGLEQLVHFVSELLLRAFLTYIGSLVPFTLYVGPICQSQATWTYLSELALSKRNRELALSKSYYFSHCLFPTHPRGHAYPLVNSLQSCVVYFLPPLVPCLLYSFSPALPYPLTSPLYL
jgi:hypothetical protein